MVQQLPQEHGAQEYDLIRQEIISIQNCITEYMKMFYGAAAAFIGIYGLLVDHGFKGLLQTAGAYIPVFLAYIVLSFTTVVFHKFNTHNRYAGYARALSQECLDGEANRDPSKVHLWESLVGFIYKPGREFSKVDFRNAGDEELISQRLEFVKENCSCPFNDWPQNWEWKKTSTAKKVRIGLTMILQATIFRARTNSWTYPFQLAFAPFATTIMLLGIWVWLVVVSFPGLKSSPLSGFFTSGYFWGVLIQLVAVFYLAASWLGLSYRLYRLCHEDGDRTIEAYCLDFMWTRFAALKRRQIDVSYLTYPLSWDKWKPKTIVASDRSREP